MTNLPRSLNGRGNHELTQTRERLVAEVELARRAIQLCEERIVMIDELLEGRK